jgi:hypothetical protein
MPSPTAPPYQDQYCFDAIEETAAVPLVGGGNAVAAVAAWPFDAPKPSNALESAL